MTCRPSAPRLATGCTVTEPRPRRLPKAGPLVGLVVGCLGSLALAGLAATPADAGMSDARCWEDEVFDEVLDVINVRKFCNGDPSNDVRARRYGAARDRYEGGYWGGDLAGVMGKLDCLTELGVTTLYLEPVVQNDRVPFGKYLAPGSRPMDYFAVDENLGRNETLRERVTQAHARDLRVILDLPLAFPGIQHPLYTEDNIANGWFGPMSPYGVRQWNAAQPEVGELLIRVATARIARPVGGPDGKARWRGDAPATRAASAPGEARCRSRTFGEVTGRARRTWCPRELLRRCRDRRQLPEARYAYTYTGLPWGSRRVARSFVLFQTRARFHCRSTSLASR